MKETAIRRGKKLQMLKKLNEKSANLPPKKLKSY
jgi:hypothetical protein